jgi:hypothetical protein
MLSKLEKSLDGADGSDDLRKRIARARMAVGRLRQNAPLLNEILDGRALRRKKHKDLLGAVAGSILDQLGHQGSAEALIRAIVKPYVRRGIRL